MSFCDTMGLTSLMNTVMKGVSDYKKNISRETFSDASFGSKLLRTVVAVATATLGLGALKVGLPLAALALSNAPLPLFFTAVAIIGTLCTAGLSLFLLVPIALFSLPLVIQSIGALICLGAGAACFGASAKSLGVI